MSTDSNYLNCLTNGSLNTTEYILLTVTQIRNLIDKADSETDWDPISFAVTAFIGVIALFFALLTIFQQLLAAGPGRHKCSRYAIGSWAELSKTSFVWSENRYRTVAYPPILDVRSLIIEWRPQTDRWVQEDKLFQPNHAPFSSHGKSHNEVKWHWKRPTDDFPATWLALLTSCGLDHPRWWNSRPQSPDYLPGEFTTTPAYASTRHLLSLLALCCDVFDVIEIRMDDDTKLPSARVLSPLQAFRTPRIELPHRVHPIIGVYAVLQTSEEALSYARPATRPEQSNTLATSAAATLQFAEGRVPQKRPLIHNRYQFSNYDAIILQDGTKRYPVEKPEIDVAHWQMWQNLPSSDGVRSVLLRHPAGISLMTADFVDSPIPIFPWRFSQFQDGVAGLILLSRHWASLGQLSVLHGSLKDFLATLSKTELSSVYSFLRSSTVGSQTLEPANQHGIKDILSRLDKQLKTVDLGILSDRYLALGVASSICVELLREKVYYLGGHTNRSSGEVPAADLEELNYSAGQTLQPKSINSTNSSYTVGSAIRRIVTSETWTANAHLPWYQKESDEARKRFSVFQKLWEICPEKKTFRYPVEQVQHPLDDLLIFRAILVAMLLSNAADNSDILENPIFDRLIPVL